MELLLELHGVALRERSQAEVSLAIRGLQLLGDLRQPGVTSDESSELLRGE